MEEPLAADAPALQPPPARSGEPPARPAPEEPPEGDRGRSPDPGWPAWTAPLALIGGVVLAAVGGLVVDLPAVALGVSITTSHTPEGIAIADTFVQDIAFVVAAVFCAHLGGRKVRSWQFGLRRPERGWKAASGEIVLLMGTFALLSVAWSEALHPSREKVLNQLGTGVLTAALICIVAPICEEILFRGYIFTALRSWRGTATAAVITGVLFGAVHAGSAPVLDLVPLAGLGFGLCLLYRHTGSLYPCIVAHSLNNSVAFASLAGLSGGEGLALAVGAVAGIAGVIAAAGRVGLITPGPSVPRTGS